MSFYDKAPPVLGDSDILNHVLRMVIPMRREHNRSLEVRQFMHDIAYAKEIIDQALASKDERLQEHAEYLSNKMFGPRNNALPKESLGKLTGTLPNTLPSLSAEAAKKASSEPAAAASSNAAEEESEAAMRARMMAKYKTGLR